MKDELIERVARAIEVQMGPLFGSPEYLADPVKLARAEKRRRDSATTFARAALEASGLVEQSEQIKALEDKLATARGYLGVMASARPLDDPFTVADLRRLADLTLDAIKEKDGE